MNNQNNNLLFITANNKTEQLLNNILIKSITVAKNSLQQFAIDPNFTNKIQIVFANKPDTNYLQTDWQTETFIFPDIEIVSATDINGANGAYARQTNKIYLAQEFLLANQLNIDTVAAVLLEEYGHYLDSQINSVDTPGDEGAIFSAVVRGEELTDSDLQQLRNEDDSATIVVDNSEISIEKHDINLDDDNVITGDHYHDEEGRRIDSPSADYIFGGGGNDRLSGLTLNDTLDGGSGIDTLIGGSGNDLYYVDRSDDVVIESGNDPDDWVISSSDTYTIPSGIEFFRVDGLGAIEGIGNNEDNQIEGGVGSNGNVANRLEGKEGNDYVIGYGGNDTLLGGEGDDILTGDEGEDSLEGNEGEDDLRGGSDNDVLNGGSDNDYLEGDEGDDILRGQGGDDRLFGDNDGEGNDRLFGGDGNDELYGDFGKDSLFGGAGSDTYLLDTSLLGGSIVNDAFEATPSPEDIDLLYFPDKDMRAYLDIGQIGVAREGVNVIIDINQDAIANADEDLSIVDFFEEETLPDGSAGYVPGVGYIEDFPLLDSFFAIEVNSTEDLSDADPFDFSPDVDLETPGLQVTLRSAIEFANNNSGFNVINFDLPSGSSLKINSALPDIEDSVSIDGPEFVAPNGDFVPTVEIDGSDAGAGVNGFTVKADNAGIFDLGIVNFEGDGILIEGDNNLLSSNYIGVDLTGNQDKGNGGNGINVQSSNNIIRHNVVSGNELSGVSMPGPNANNNEIFKNKLGINANGTEALGNNINGIFISAGEENIIKENTIGGNKNNGIVLDDNSRNNVIENNNIGINFDEDSNEIDLGNGTRGIWIRDGSNNRIGGLEAETQENSIAYNEQAGVGVISGTGNSILGNSIFKNKSLAIDLGDDSFTPNDLLDTDLGANSLQNHPINSDVIEIESEDETTKKIIGSLNSTPNTTFRVEFFTDSGKTLYEAINVTTDAQGNVEYTIDTPNLEVGTSVYGTATNLATNDTSELYLPNTIEFSETFLEVTEGGTNEKGEAETINPLVIRSGFDLSNEETLNIKALTSDESLSLLSSILSDYILSVGTVSNIDNAYLKRISERFVDLIADATDVPSTSKLRKITSNKIFKSLVPVFGDFIAIADVLQVAYVQGLATDEDIRPNPTEISITFPSEEIETSQENSQGEFLVIDDGEKEGDQYLFLKLSQNGIDLDTEESLVVIRDDDDNEFGITIEEQDFVGIGITALGSAIGGAILGSLAGGVGAIPGFAIGAVAGLAEGVAIEVGEDVIQSLIIDFIIAQKTNKSRIGELISDILNGTEGDDVLEGNDGDNNLNGDEGNDILEGNGGDDDLNGGLGNDTLIGSEGIDTFSGNLAELDGDVISDFTQNDLIQVEDAIFTRDNINITLGSAIIDIDADLDGTVDSTITLEGDFSNTNFIVEPVSLGGVSNTFITISEPTVTEVSIFDVSQAEGNEGNTEFSFTVSLNEASTETITIDYATADDSAKAGEDYIAINGTVEFEPGETTKTITVELIGDRNLEEDETFNVRLSNSVNAALADGRGIGTIINDDSTDETTIAIDDVSVTEGNENNSEATFTVTLSEASDETITVDYATADDTATAGEDYTATEGTLEFAPGETQKTITVSVLADRDLEENETFNIRLSNPSNAVFSNSRGVATITNDDAAPSDNLIELFRFRNKTFDTGTYVFVGEAEKNFILNDENLSNTFELDGVAQDGTMNPAFTASTVDGDDLIPFYRLESLAVAGTFLFVSTAEYDFIFDDPVQSEQWKKQGFDSNDDTVDIPEFYLMDSSADRGIQFNRFQNLQNGTYLYAGEAETEAIESNSNLAGLFVNQGEAFESFV